jgi:hypothetical protein
MRRACLLAAVAASLLFSGCVTIGYDFLTQQATVTVQPGYKK